jgi:hypothetical protein
VYAQKLAAGDQEAIAILRGISPVAWQHVNLFEAIWTAGLIRQCAL